MVSPNWSILQPVDVGERFQQGLQLGQRNALLQEERAYQQEGRQRERTMRNALTGAIDPATGNIDYGVARRAFIGAGDVQGAIGVDTARRSQEAAARAQLVDRVVRGARIVRRINPTDDASWQQVLAAAQRAGTDITDVPRTFDPAYRDQLLAAADANTDPSEGFTLGEGDVRVDQSGRVVARGAPQRPRYIPVPPGGRLELDPSYQGPTTGPAQGEVTATNPQTGERIRMNPQTQQWEPIAQGGAEQPSPRTFPQ